MVALFLCQNVDFMYDILDAHIAASYGMDRLTSEQYKKAQEDILTPDQEEAQHLPGPFSYAEYVGALLDESFWGGSWSPAGHLYDVASHHHCLDC